jgi:predicted nucleotidyltransferase
VEACEADDRIVAAFLGGSIARGEADEYSDLDLCAITRNDAYEEVMADRADLIGRLGEPLFLEDFGVERNVFFILADGTEGEVFIFRESELDRIDAGPYRTLLDEGGILADAKFTVPGLDVAERVEELRQILLWFWHDVSHFVSAIGRGQLWWAAGQLEMLRAYCVNLERIDQGVETTGDEAYWKLDQSISTDRVAAIRETFVPIDRRAMLRAAQEIVAFHRERAPVVAAAQGLTYPEELARLIGGQLDELTAR